MIMWLDSCWQHNVVKNRSLFSSSSYFDSKMSLRMLLIFAIWDRWGWLIVIPDCSVVVTVGLASLLQILTSYLVNWLCKSCTVVVDVKQWPELDIAWWMGPKDDPSEVIWECKRPTPQTAYLPGLAKLPSNIKYFLWKLILSLDMNMLYTVPSVDRNGIM